MDKTDVFKDTETQAGIEKCKMWLKDSFVEIPIEERKKYKKPDGKCLSSYPYIAAIAFGLQHQISIPNEGIYSTIELYRKKGFVPLSEAPKEVQEAYAIVEKVHKADPLYKTSYLKHKVVDDVNNETTE